MKDIAILSLLWNKHTRILIHYLEQLPDPTSRTIFLLYDIDPGVIQTIKRLGAHVVLIGASMLPREVHLALKKKVQNTLCALAGEFKQPNWAAFCESVGIPQDNTAAVISQLVSEKLPAAVAIIKALDAIQHTYDIEIMMTSEDVMFDTRVAIMWGRRAGVPSLHFEHGPVVGLSFSVHWDVFADHMTVYGLQAANAFSHIERHRISVVGNQAADVYQNLLQHKREIRQQMVKKYQLPLDQPIVVFATTTPPKLSTGYDPKIHEKTLIAMFSAKRLLMQTQPFSLVIKERLSDLDMDTKARLCAHLAQQCGLALTDYRFVTSDIEALITAADIVVASESSVNIEAMHVNTPTISLTSQFGLFRWSVFHVEDGIAEVCDCDPNVLSYYIDQLLNNRHFRHQQLTKMQAHVSRYSHTAQTGSALDNETQVMRKLISEAHRDVK